MLTNVASQLTPRARCARGGALGSLAPTGVVVLRTHQQTRSFRFGGKWSSYLDTDFHREMYRRHRKFKYKYVETLNRRQAWEKHPFADDVKLALRRMVHNSWNSRDARPGGRYVNMDAVRQATENPEGVRPGQNIEDVERGAMEDLMFGKKNPLNEDEYDHLRSPFQNLRHFMAKRRAQILDQFTADSTAKSADAARSDNLARASGTVVEPSDVEYVFDPISNRKVRKSSSAFDQAGDPPATTFKAYRSQFSPHNLPPHPPAADQPIFYDGPPPEAELKQYDQVSIDAKPWDGTQSRAAINASSSTVSMDPEAKSPVVETDVPAGQLDPESQTRRVVRDERYWRSKSIFWATSDGIVPPSTEKGSPGVKLDVNSLFSWWTEPGEAVAAQKYNDLDKYKPVMNKEDDLSPSTSVEPEYKDLGKYKPEVDKVEDATEDPTAKYEDLGEYKPVRYQEPDGKPLDAEEAPPEDLKKYEPVRYNEPDGKPQTTEQSAADVQELGEYTAVRHNEPDGKPLTAEEGNNEYDPAELSQYTAFRHSEPDGLYANRGAEPTPDPAELGEYAAFRYNEPDGKPPLTAEEGTSEAAAELGEYKAVRYLEPDGKPLAEAADGSYELGGYSAVRYNEPDGKPAVKQNTVEDCLAEFDAENPVAYDEVSTERMHDDLVEDVDSLRASDIRAAFEPEKILTGNYVRDFPEEFAKSWTLAGSPSESTLLPNSMEASSFEQAVQQEEREQVEGAEFDTATRLEPALDRQPAKPRRKRSLLAKVAALADPYSTDPQGLETSYTEECNGQSTWPTFVKSYGSLNSEPTFENVALPMLDRPVLPVEPTLYKILAYDPTMQKINIADTTSIVPDSSSPLTPSEVLLRLSNPAKFFPHFSPLQAQGYEIVSGSGDILVFRKVRAETPATATAPAGADAQLQPELSAATVTAQSVNPVDMTGASTSTGALGYSSPIDTVAAAAASAASAFKSNIDVRREEPVFSGPKAEPKSKKNLGKRVLVGAGWVAGVSYALGVVGEYFKTGGMDGKGPKGF